MSAVLFLLAFVSILTIVALGGMFSEKKWNSGLIFRRLHDFWRF